MRPHGENCRQPQALGTPFHEACGTSQAACTPIILLPTVSGSGRFLCSPHTQIGGTSQALCAPMMKIADSLRLCAPPFTKIWGRLRLCTPPMMKFADSRRLCAPFSRNLRDVSSCLHPHHKIADSLRLWAFSVLRSHQNWGTSQALCTPMMKIADSLRLCEPPRAKLGGWLRFGAPPMMNIADRLRL